MVVGLVECGLILCSSEKLNHRMVLSWLTYSTAPVGPLPRSLPLHQLDFTAIVWARQAWAAASARWAVGRPAPGSLSAGGDSGWRGADREHFEFFQAPSSTCPRDPFPLTVLHPPRKRWTSHQDFTISISAAGRDGG